MKQNKNIQPINLEQDVELTIQPDFQSAPFVIVGDAEAVMPLAEQAQAYDKTHEARTSRVSHVSKHIGSTMLEAPKTAVSGLVGRLSVDIKAVAYDKVYGTSMYDLLKQKRDDERNLAFATKLGLVSTTHCAKHSKALAQLKRIV